MVDMGGGPTAPVSNEAKEKVLVTAVLPWPEKVCEKSIHELKDEFDDVEVQFFYSHFENGKVTGVDVPEGVYRVFSCSFISGFRDWSSTSFAAGAIYIAHAHASLTRRPETLKRTTYLTTLFWLPPNASSIPSTKLIQFVSAGTNHVSTHPIYTDSKIPLCSANGVHGPQIAEWVIMMNLVHSHGYPALYDAQKEHRWNQKQGMKVSDRVGKRVGILGYGSIGRQVARVCKAMGMDVIAYTASARETPEARRDGGFIVPGTGDPEGELPSKWYSGTGKEALHEFLKQEIDLLVVGVPLT
jgi:hypothetical protein